MLTPFPQRTERDTLAALPGGAGNRHARGPAVADDSRDTPRPFDVRTVEYLLRLMTEHDLSEVEFQKGDHRIRLCKEPKAAPAAAVPGNPAAPAAGLPAQPTSPVPAKSFHEIKSELPGTFYTRPAPDKPEFVKVGSKVTPDTIVCLIIAMKVENPIRAGVSGTVVEVVAQNEQFVDFNAVLFRVDPG